MAQEKRRSCPGRGHGRGLAVVQQDDRGGHAAVRGLLLRHDVQLCPGRGKMRLSRLLLDTAFEARAAETPRADYRARRVRRTGRAFRPTRLRGRFASRRGATESHVARLTPGSGPGGRGGVVRAHALAEAGARQALLHRRHPGAREPTRVRSGAVFWGGGKAGGGDPFGRREGLWGRGSQGDSWRVGKGLGRVVGGGTWRALGEVTRLYKGFGA